MHENECVLVVGASNNPEKYGNRIVKNLKSRGFLVVPINPKESIIEGLKAYPSLTLFVQQNPKIPVQWVDIVVPPAVTEQIVQEAKQVGLKNVWLQPGSESTTAISFCEKNGMRCIHHACIMVDYP